MKYLIFGRKEGWLAQKFGAYLEDSVISETDITNLEAVRAELDDKKPMIVINAAGITGRPNIDWCDSNAAETVAVNIAGPYNIAKACEERLLYLVHLSSGCIFQGDKGFTEEDKPEPPSFYSWSKYWAEQAILSIKGLHVLIIRLRLPIDVVPNPRNLINKLVKYSQVIDSENSITVIPDMLWVVKNLIDKGRIGIYHVVNPGSISPAKIMELYKKIIDPTHTFKIIKDEDLYSQDLATAKRSNCILNSDKLAFDGILLKPIDERIIEVLEEYKKNISI